MLQGKPEWNVIEVELSSHNPYDHIIPQISKFVRGIKNPMSQQQIAGAIYDVIINDAVLAAKVKKEVATGEVFKFISLCISKVPRIIIVVEKKTPELEEALEGLAILPHVVEFRTFVSQGLNKSAHAHLFEQLDKQVIEPEHSEYRTILENLRKKITLVRPQLKTAKPSEYYGKVAVGHSGIHLEWLFKATQDKLGVELHLERATYAENSRLLTRLEQRKTELENNIGESLTFQSQWGKRWSRIYTERKLNQAPDYQDWAVATMIKFYDFFKPLLDKVDNG